LDKSSQERLDEFPHVTRRDGLRPRLAVLMRRLAALDQALAVLEKQRSALTKPRRRKRPK